MRVRHFTRFAAALLLATACGDDHTSCDPVANTGCGSGLACERVDGGAPACFDPVVVKGRIFDLAASTTGLGDARVVALDPNRAPLGTVALSGTDGAYELRVPQQRKADGTPVGQVTLRVDRAGYQTFPGGVRQALPIDLGGATHASGAWTVQTTLTDVGLMALPAGAAAAAVHGTAARSAAGGVLVVAEPVGGGAVATGIADSTGAYAIFNLTPGIAYVVKGYAKGVNYQAVTTNALPAGDTALPQLALASGAGASFTGGLIFNNGASSAIQVTLVPSATYNANLDRGETPPGLTVGTDAGGSTYSFTGVPDGDWRVLAAFGLDGDVRGESGTGNTDSPAITVQGGTVQASPPNFKIVPAVDLRTIDAVAVSGTPAVVKTATPTFTWQKGSVDSAAATYRVTVLDGFGVVLWSQDVAAVAGTNTLAYAGPALAAGMSYQLRILAIQDAIPVPATFKQLSKTEDLAGVFTYQP